MNKENTFIKVTKHLTQLSNHPVRFSPPHNAPYVVVDSGIVGSCARSASNATNAPTTIACRPRWDAIRYTPRHYCRKQNRRVSQSTQCHYYKTDIHWKRSFSFRCVFVEWRHHLFNTQTDSFLFRFVLQYHQTINIRCSVFTVKFDASQGKPVKKTKRYIVHRRKK